jgi:hypothetical protein
LRIFANIAGENYRVRMPGIDHLHRLPEVCGSVGRVFVSDVCIADLRDRNLSDGD